MNDAIIGKMTFYDIVTLIVPGALICYAVRWPAFPEDSNWIAYVAQFGFVLMIGLIIKSISMWWGKMWFRNNTDIIKMERILLSNGGGEHISCRFLSTFIFHPIRYIVGPLGAIGYTQNSSELHDYYNKYNDAYKDVYYGKRIEFLENHVAFLQSWVWALVVCMFVPVSCQCNCCCLTCAGWSPCVLILFCYICIVLMLCIQRKIYQLVFESEKYVAKTDRVHTEDIKHERREVDKIHNEVKPTQLQRIFFVVSIFTGLLLLLFFIFVGRNKHISTIGDDWATFATYIGTIGTMLFTAVYAYSFIQLQGAMNESTRVKEESNNMDRARDKERKLRKNLVFLLASVESSVHVCMEYLETIKIPKGENRLSDEAYNKFEILLNNINNNLTLLSTYHNENSSEVVSKESKDRILSSIDNMSQNITQCIADAKGWNNNTQSKSSIRKIIANNLDKTYNIAKNTQMIIASAFL